ncbi:MAG: PAS domain S-box protein [Leptolyngbyaceae cyanobacterium SL_1_1]|nr:PAS domain S-box protein [Leptolyngbyaceae cyanobacterium SL_1_1]
MHRYQVSCVAITRRQNGQPEGLVTAGDLVQCLQLGCDFAKISAQTLMSTPPFCTTSATTLWTAHQQMQQHCIHQLLVCDLHGNLQGIVTQTDVLQSMDPTELLSSIQALQQTVEQQNSTLQAMTAALQRQSSQQQQIKAQLKQTEASLAQDVTERKRTELALFASEERWQQLAEKLQLITANAPVCIYEINRSGQVTFANRIDPGIASGQILGNHLSNWFPLRQSHIIESAIAQVFQTHEIRAIAYEIPDSQGTAHAYETQVAPILIDGEVTSAVLIASDVTQRQQAEARLKEQAALIDIATDAILVRSLDDEVIFWSKGAERIYGWSAKAALGQSLNQLLNQKPSPELEAAWKTVLTQGEWQGELQKYTHSGKVLTIESRWTLVRDRAGNPQSILSVDTDITAKRQLEVQFLRAQRLESLGTLASGIAHDLNNLMTPILGIAHLLSILLKDADEKIQELLEIQLSSVRRGTALVKQILSFARGAEGKYTVMQLRHVINEVKAFSAKTFPKSISIQTDLARDLWTIQGDATHLHQVLMNLCVNARDAMLKGGSLMLSAENFYFDQAQAQRLLDAKPGPYIIVAVTDTGTGIPPEVVDRIFDPFFTTKVPGQGTGLGLSTAVGIVKSHGGFLTVSSQPGQGTQFKVYLPAIAAPLPVTTAEQPLPRGSQELILVVDDETPVCKTARTMLETYNYRVMTATEGTKAIAFYRQHHTQISAVLVDLMMPALDGFAVIRALQNIKPAVKVIALSGLATNQARLETEGAAVHAFLNKPYSLDDLLQTLHQVLHDLSPSKVET